MGCNQLRPYTYTVLVDAAVLLPLVVVSAVLLALLSAVLLSLAAGASVLAPSVGWPSSLALAAALALSLWSVL